MDEFDGLAAGVCARAGVEVSSEDLALIRLVYDAAFAHLSVLERIDRGAMPFEPVNPARAPGG
jgi:hypothetical protein